MVLTTDNALMTFSNSARISVPFVFQICMFVYRQDVRNMPKVRRPHHISKLLK